MKISFVIPARNEHLTINATLASLHRNAGKHGFEIIVVDDCSEPSLQPDPSFSAILVRNQERQGVSRSRNIGAKAASGEIIIFLDAHVGFEPGFLDRLLSEKHLLSSGIIGTATQLVDNLETFLSFCSGSSKAPPGDPYYGWKIALEPSPDVVPVNNKLSDSVFRVPVASACCLAVNRNFFEEIGQFEDELTGFGSIEDTEFSLRCWVTGSNVYLNPHVICYHYTRPGTQPSTLADQTAAPPLFDQRYEPNSVENALRVMYLHFSSEHFNSLLEGMRSHPQRQVNYENFLSQNIKQRRENLNMKRKFDHAWLLQFLSEFS